MKNIYEYKSYRKYLSDSKKELGLSMDKFALLCDYTSGSMMCEVINGNRPMRGPYAIAFAYNTKMEFHEALYFLTLAQTEVSTTKHEKWFNKCLIKTLKNLDIRI